MDELTLIADSQCGYCGKELRPENFGAMRLDSEEGLQRFVQLHVRACRDAAAAPVDPMDELGCESCQ